MIIYIIYDNRDYYSSEIVAVYKSRGLALKCLESLYDPNTMSRDSFNIDFDITEIETED